MQKEIGSNFWIDPDKKYPREGHIELDLYGMQGTDSVLLSSGRAAEAYVLDTIQERNKKVIRRALVPPYTCHTVIEPFLKRGYNISCYSIDSNLNVVPEKFREELLKSQADVVLFHRYFGFDTWKGCSDIIQEFSKIGVVFIEDKTHSLYSKVEDFSVDYYVGSLRKWAGVPDGGYALCREGQFNGKPELVDKKFERMKLEASYAKHRYMKKNIGKKDDFLQQYQRAEDILDTQTDYFKISPVSECIQAGLNIEWMKEKRRENYEIVYQNLKNISSIKILTGELEREVTPLYLAILYEKRETLQHSLKEDLIYAPVVWPRMKSLPSICEEAEKVYRQVLCLPIDQRYDVDDMERMSSCIRRNT